MSFQHTLSLPLLYQEIKERQESIARLPLVEFDDEEYEQLRSWAKCILQNYNSFSSTTKQQARVIFLAFACEYVRRKKPTDDNVFWDDFHKELGLIEKQLNLCYELLWTVYKEEGIEQQQGTQNRLIVRSLLHEVHTSETTIKSCMAFFCWFYQIYEGDQQQVTQSLIESYNRYTYDNKLFIHSKAIPRLNQEVQFLHKILQYATENNIIFDENSPEDYRQSLLNALGPAYDIYAIYFIRNGNRLGTLFKVLENPITPHNFLHLLKNKPQAKVTPPANHEMDARMAYQRWKSRRFPYGTYRLDNIAWQVVPQTWLSLKTIESWPTNTVIPLKRSGYVGYKKSKEFVVKIGRDQKHAQRCYTTNGTTCCYIWVGLVTQGEPFYIDDQYCPQSAGIQRRITLCINLMQENPELYLVFNTFKAFFPDDPGKQITITTSQGEEWSKSLPINGQLNYNHHIKLPISYTTQSVQIWFSLGQQECAKPDFFHPEQAYLFSVQTQARIPASEKLEFGEQQYYLLALPTEQLIYDPDVVSHEEREGTYGNLQLYYVRWKEHRQPFSLQVGSLKWVFQHRYTISIHTAETSTGYLRLARHQLHSFRQSSLSVYCFPSLTQIQARCQIYCENELLEEENMTACLQETEKRHSYRFSAGFLERVDTTIIQRYGTNRYQHYDILIVNSDDQLIDMVSLTMLPEVNIETNAAWLTLEGRPRSLTISSPHVPLWDMIQSRENSTITYQVFPYLVPQEADIASLPKGITPLGTQRIKKPLVFPTLGETVECEFTIPVLAIRLYYREKPNTPYQLIDSLNYYTLEDTAIVIYTKPQAIITLQVADKTIRKAQASNDGFLVLENLAFLRSEIMQEQTTISIISQQAEASVTLYWRPTISSWSLSNGILQGNIHGPQTTAIEIACKTISDTLLFTRYLPCQGQLSPIELDITNTIPKNTFCYLIPSYILSDGTRIVAAQQWRVEPAEPSTQHQHFKISEEWLNLGIGLSDPSLLPMLF
jgi:hypothetical protein